MEFRFEAAVSHFTHLISHFNHFYFQRAISIDKFVEKMQTACGRIN